MAAAILQGRDLAVLLAEQNDRVVADPACQYLLAELVGPRGDIPGVANEHVALLRSKVCNRLWDGVESGVNSLP
jgi:hypothetical protein